MKFGKWVAAGILALGANAYAQNKPDPSQPNPQPTPSPMDQNDQNKPTNDHNKTTVTMSDLPPAVKTTVDRESKGKTVEEMSKVEQNGKTIYQVEIVTNGKSQQLDISETGTVLKRHPKQDETTKPGNKGN
jgi:glucose/arabinose dehydrogenase